MISRRNFIKFATNSSAAIAAVLAFPNAVLAWAEKAFSADSLSDAVNTLYPGMLPEDSPLVKLKAPKIAENGAVVPITVSTELPDVSSISVFVADNPNPLTASFNLDPMAVANISVRIRMSKTSRVVAIVKSGEKIFQTSQEVKVTIGGCGG